MIQFFIGILLIMCGVGTLEADVPMTNGVFVFSIVSILLGLLLSYIGTENQQ